MASRPRPFSADEIKHAFMEFFAERGHLELPSSSLVPQDDPTVLLTTAGMQQMVPFMLGRREPPRRRLTSCQKVFRSTDIEKVGNLRTLTFFEMLGNFSIGDYFKEAIIPWAWEFVTEWLGLPADRVWITVHPTDDEARRIWRESVGIPESRIVALEENFWGPPGAEGPCGPDSELYLDRGLEYGCGRPTCAPGCDCERFLEFWNLVFMQFYQDRQGKRTELARKNIDTGLGLERMAVIMQGTESVYETDLFQPILARAQELAGLPYGRDPQSDFALRVITEHGRAMTFLVGDGVLPSNEGRGYVLRRVLRRAVRYGRQLKIEGPFLGHIVDAVVDRMAARYPELRDGQSYIRRVIEVEEERFSATLQSGLSMLDRTIEEARARGAAVLGGEILFRLYDTYGFPPELSEEILQQAGLAVDRQGFKAAMEEQRSRSRAAARFAQAAYTTAQLAGQLPPTEFLGYTTLEADATVLAISREGLASDVLAEGETGLVVVDRTPFYAEAGGQVGDTGALTSDQARALVEDTQSDGQGHHLHRVRLEAGELRVGQRVHLVVDGPRRRAIMRHHTVTHLLHKALQEVLGPQATQAGSLVAPHVARFDFPHDRPLTEEEKQAIVRRINEHILAAEPVSWRLLPKEEALALGAQALFGEKYGEVVRVVEVDGYSRELCGGTHVSNTGEIGLALLVSESGIGSGLRRVEVITGEAALAHATAQAKQLHAIAQIVGGAIDNVVERVQSLQEELRQTRKELQRLARQFARQQAEQLAANPKRVDGVAVIAQRVEAQSPDDLVAMVDVLRPRLDRWAIVLGAVIDGKPFYVASVSKDLVGASLDAPRLVREITGGKGGGKPDLAKAGGTDAGAMQEALARVPDLVARAVG